MAATYIEITRAEFEDWLSTLSHKWSRDHHTAGIYYVHLSDRVAVKISSSIGKNDSAMGRAAASIEIVLASRVTGKTLNRKGGEQSRYHRTKNWRSNLAGGISHWEQVYKGAQEFYERIAPVGDREKYKSDRLKILDRVGANAQDDILMQIRTRLVQGGVLPEREEAVLRVAESLSDVQIKFLQRLDSLRTNAKRDPTTLALVVDVRRMVWSGESLPSMVKQQLAVALKKYGV